MGSKQDQPRNAPRRRTFAGFAAEKAAAGYRIHIIDDDGEVFEIEASRANVELIHDSLERLLSVTSSEDSHAKG